MSKKQLAIVKTKKELLAIGYTENNFGNLKYKDFIVFKEELLYSKRPFIVKYLPEKVDDHPYYMVYPVTDMSFAKHQLIFIDTKLAKILYG